MNITLSNPVTSDIPQAQAGSGTSSSPAVTAVKPGNIDAVRSRDSQEWMQKDLLSRRTEEREKQDPAMNEVKQLAEEMNEIMDDLGTSLGFSIREDLDNQVVIEIKNRETDELVRQIPAEQMISIREKMVEFTGLIFDQSV